MSETGERWKTPQVGRRPACLGICTEADVNLA
jgi:hypothetical protein